MWSLVTKMYGEALLHAQTGRVVLVPVLLVLRCTGQGPDPLPVKRVKGTMLSLCRANWFTFS